MDRTSLGYLFYGIISIAILTIFLIFVCAVLSWHNDGVTEDNIEYQPVPIIEPNEEKTESPPPIVKPLPRKRKKPTAFAASVEGLANMV